jgi:hypothetical protein
MAGGFSLCAAVPFPFVRSQVRDEWNAKTGSISNPDERRFARNRNDKNAKIFAVGFSSLTGTAGALWGNQHAKGIRLRGDEFRADDHALRAMPLEEVIEGVLARLDIILKDQIPKEYESLQSSFHASVEEFNRTHTEPLSPIEERIQYGRMASTLLGGVFRQTFERVITADHYPTMPARLARFIHMLDEYNTQQQAGRSR